VIKGRSANVAGSEQAGDLDSTVSEVSKKTMLSDPCFEGISSVFYFEGRGFCCERRSGGEATEEGRRRSGMRGRKSSSQETLNEPS